MKTIVTTTLLILLTFSAHASLREVEYTLGPKLFRDGDSIKIEEVKATSTKFKVGETVTVKGSYTLKSRKEANLSIILTQSEGDGESKILPGQQYEVREGEGDFEVTIKIRHEGYLHLTFYPTEGGSGFGGVYFGKRSEMKEIEDWTLQWYLEDAVVQNDIVNQSD